MTDHKLKLLESQSESVIVLWMSSCTKHYNFLAVMAMVISYLI